jgi:hypothetical protein
MMAARYRDFKDGKINGMDWVQLRSGEKFMKLGRSEDIAFKLYSRKGSLAVEKFFSLDEIKSPFTETCDNLFTSERMPCYSNLDNGIFVLRRDDFKWLGKDENGQPLNKKMNLNCCPEFISYCKLMSPDTIKRVGDNEYVYICAFNNVVGFLQRMFPRTKEICVIDTSCDNALGIKDVSHMLYENDYVALSTKLSEFIEDPVEALNNILETETYLSSEALDKQYIPMIQGGEGLRLAITSYFNLARDERFNQALTDETLRSCTLIIRAVKEFVATLLDEKLAIKMYENPEVVALSRASLILESDRIEFTSYDKQKVSYFLPGWKQLNFTTNDLLRLIRTDTARNPFGMDPSDALLKNAVKPTRSILPLRGGTKRRRRRRVLYTKHIHKFKQGSVAQALKF